MTDFDHEIASTVGIFGDHFTAKVISDVHCVEFVISTHDEDLTRIVDFDTNQNVQGFKRIGSAIHIISEKDKIAVGVADFPGVGVNKVGDGTNKRMDASVDISPKSEIEPDRIEEHVVDRTSRGGLRRGFDGM